MRRWVGGFKLSLPLNNPQAFYRRPCAGVGVGNMNLALVGGAFKPEVSRLSSVVHVF